MHLIYRRPIVSVILASYNHADYIDEAILSVLDQDTNDIEVIVVDDGSTDGTPDRAEAIRDSRIKLIRLNENRRKHPRNTALSIARGKYVAFQNSDDSWEKGKLIKQLEILEKDSKTVACFTDVEIVDEKGGILTDSWANGLFQKENQSSSDWLRRFFDKGNCLCISSALVRKNKIKEVGFFNPSLIQLSDFDLWVRLAATGEFYIIDEKLTRMRIVTGSNLSRPSSVGRRRSILEHVEVLDRYARQPVSGRLHEAFSDVLPNINSEIANLGGLAVYAWTLSAPHILLGNRIIAEIMNDPLKREELVSVFGIEIIHNFIENRGRVELLLADGGNHD